MSCPRPPTVAEVSNTTRLPAATRRALIAVFALTVVVLPFGTRVVGDQSSFLPLVVSTVFLGNIVSVYLLCAWFREAGNLRLVITATAFVWSAVTIVGYTLMFPGLISVQAPLGAWPSSPVWMYALWHVGFPIILACAWAYPQRWGTHIPMERRATVVRLVIILATLVAVLVVQFVALAGERLLPSLLDGSILDVDTGAGGALGILVAIVSAIVLTRRLQGSVGPERWVMVAAWICVADLTLAFASGARFAVGWYAGWILTIVGSSLVFLVMLGEFAAMQRQVAADRTMFRAQARTDDLTGLGNRLALREALVARLGSRSPGAFMLLDLDRFKVINDTLGHEAGDSVLIETSRRIESICAGQLVVRLGGDEFAVLFDSPDGLETAAAELLDGIGCRYDIDVAGTTAAVHVGVSIGLTTLNHQTSASAVLREADLALYQAKGNGRGQLGTFDESLNVSVDRRFQIEVMLRNALAADGIIAEAFPIVTLNDGARRGVELQARLRDHHGVRSAPPELIAVAEDAGLLAELDLVMLTTAAAMVADDPANTLGSIGVSVSSHTLAHPRLDAIVAGVLEVVGDAACRIDVHVSERVLLDSTHDVAGGIAALRGAGLRVGLGDFGTGHSVLSALRRVPLDFLKVAAPERTLPSGTQQPAMTSALLSVADALALTVIMEAPVDSVA